MKTQIVRQLEEHVRVIQGLAAHQADTLQAMARIVIEALARGGRIYLAGNGGSAADAQHWAAELLGRFRQERPALPAVALTTDTSVLTAVGNDYGFDQVFARQMEALVGAGDVLVAISTSGQSLNVARAAAVARRRGAKVLALTGRQGGQLQVLADVTLRVDSDETCRVQEAHAVAGHILCDLVEQAVVRGEIPAPGDATRNG